MIVEEFEGKNEQDAIDQAIAELGLTRDDIDVEIIENKKAGLFRTGNVRIRVHVPEDEDEADFAPATELEGKMLDYVSGLLERMGFDATVNIVAKEEGKITIDMESGDSAILIGRKGATLEALQFITNVAAGRMGAQDLRIILDTQDYRSRRQKSLIRMAKKSAEHVRATGESHLLEPMNPYERRLVHTALNEMDDIATISEGEGLFKRIRICYREARLDER